MNSSDSAEEVIKISLEGMEIAFKVMGIGAKNIAVAIYTIMKDNQKATRGKTRLTNMLKTNKPLKIFTIKAKDLKKFSEEAKRYGVLYCALANKKNEKIDGMVDIMVREEDAVKINRIAERFNFKDVATIKKELEREKQSHIPENEQLEMQKNTKEQFIDDVLPKSKEQREIPSNSTKNTEKKNQSENSLTTKSKDVEISKKENKKSVKEELKEIEQEIKVKEQQEIRTDNIMRKDNKKQARHYKEKEERHKGKRYKEPKHLDTSKVNKSKKKKTKERSV